MPAPDAPPGTRAAAIQPLVERELGDYIDHWDIDATTIRVEGCSHAPAPDDIETRVRAGASAIEAAADVDVDVGFGADYFEVVVQYQAARLPLDL